jgi:hypothetical protein
VVTIEDLEKLLPEDRLHYIINRDTGKVIHVDDDKEVEKLSPTRKFSSNKKQNPKNND